MYTIKAINKLLLDIYGSFNNEKWGFSSKKIIAFHAMMLYSIVILSWTISCYKSGQWDNMAITSVLGSIVALIAASIGLNIWDKNSKKQNEC